MFGDSFSIALVFFQCPPDRPVAIQPAHMLVTFGNQELRGDLANGKRVLASHDHCAGEVLQRPSHHLRACHIEVVGWLVQKQECQIHANAVTQHRDPAGVNAVVLLRLRQPEEA
jgi:hypothetical protein